jgi:hypothetical protein
MACVFFYPSTWLNDLFDSMSNQTSSQFGPKMTSLVKMAIGS